MTRPNTDADFWPKVTVGTADECWPSTGYRNQTGYGRFVRRRHQMLAHRVAWELTNGPIPSGLCVLHRCDNPPCCNPAHLFLGTHADNMRDMESKGRGYTRNRFGELNHNVKLTSEQVIYLRFLYFAERRSQSEIGKFFGVEHSTVGRIVNGKSWVTGATHAE